MDQGHGDKLLEVVEEHIKRCGDIGMAAMADGHTFVAGQAFTACKLAERVRDTLSGNHTTPATAIARLPFDPPPKEKKPRAPRKPRAATAQSTLADAGVAQKPDTNGAHAREAD